MIESTKINKTELGLVLIALERYFESCKLVRNYQDRHVVEKLLGKMYELINDRCIIDLPESEIKIETKEFKRKFEIKEV
jgi:hypothetical protein